MRPESKWVALPSVRVFDEVNADKAHALKPLEEAAEVFGAWQEWDEFHGMRAAFDGPSAQIAAAMKGKVVDECCDTISAVCNFLAAMGVYDLTEAMRRCRERNARRGRISDGTSV